MPNLAQGIRAKHYAGPGTGHSLLASLPASPNRFRCRSCPRSKMPKVNTVAHLSAGRKIPQPRRNGRRSLSRGETMARPIMSAMENPAAEIKDRVQLLFSIHHAVPRSLPGPFLATHFVRLNESPEDRSFARAAKLAQKCFGEDIDQDHPELFRSMPGIRSKIVTTIRSHYESILENAPAMFVFGSEAAVIDLLARRVTDELGHPEGLVEAFRVFMPRFREFWKETYKDYLSKLGREIAGIRFDADPKVAELGGIRHWLEENERLDQRQSEIETALGDFRYLRLRSHAADEFVRNNVRYHVRWERIPQGWNYSFIETLNLSPRAIRHRDLLAQRQQKLDYIEYITGMVTCFAVDPNVPNAAGLAEVPDDVWFPGATLAGAHYLMLGVDALIAICVAWRRISGFPDVASEGEDEFREYASFPGLAPSVNARTDRVAETVKRFRKIGAETGIDEKELHRRAREFIRSMDGGHVRRRAAVAELIRICLVTLRPERISETLRLHTMSTVPKEAINAILELDIVPASYDLTLAEYQSLAIVRLIERDGTAITDPSVYDFLGSMVIEGVQSHNTSKEVRCAIFTALAHLTREFWVSAMGGSAHSMMHDADDDYVASSMADFQCLYFSNFVPLGKELFTRTIFVDVGLGPYQRARMLQRFANILSYRSLAIRDLARVRNAVDGLLDVSRGLNDIQSIMAIPRAFGDGEEPRFLELNLGRVIEMAARAGYMNSFLTYGIVGRRMSAASYVEQIRERCADVREERLRNYPMLIDFLERRLMHSVRNYDRMEMHYNAVTHRINALMDMIRTRLNAVQTHEMSDNIGEMARTARTMTVASENLQRAADRVDINLRAQLDLQVAAEVIVLFGGSYYAFEIVRAVSSSVPRLQQVSDWALVCIGVVAAVGARIAVAPVTRHAIHLSHRSVGRLLRILRLR